MAEDSGTHEGAQPEDVLERGETDPGSDRSARMFEVLAVILLAVASVAAAWSAYQSARWGGVQATATANANTARLESSRASATGGQLVQIDVGTFFQAVDAFASDDRELLDFYTERMRPEFRPTFDEWVSLEPLTNPDAPLSPFEFDSYRVAELEDAERLDLVAEEETDAAADARRHSNAYSIAVPILAAALFFAGISTRFSSIRVRVGLLIVGALAFGLVVALLSLLPKSVAL